jgi:hypothetical protein
MSTSAGTRSTSTRPLNVREQLRQRGIDATRHLNDTLRLSATASDTRLLGTALAEIVVEESARNPQLAARVRARYDELESLRGAPRGGNAARTREVLPPLEPIRTDLPYRYSQPGAPPDPKWLIQVYGQRQLARALQDFSLDMLKLTADKVQAAHPGTRPANRGRKAAVIDYIVKYSGE